MEELKEEIVVLKNNKKVFYEYLKAFYNIEKVRDTMKDKDEFKYIEELLKKEDD